MNSLNVIRTAPVRKYDLMARRKRLTEHYATANQEAARIVLADVEKFGHGSLLHEWASAVLNGPEAANLQWWRKTA